MDFLEELAKYSTIIFVIGLVLFVVGFLLKANAKKDTAASVFSTIFLTIGVFLLMIALGKWISDSIGNWSFISDRMI
jgi:uncharacterized membrane protein